MRLFCKIGLLVACIIAVAIAMHAQHPEPNAPQQQQPEADPPDTIFPGHQWNRFWFSGQLNLIEQGHGGFFALYSGPRSLSNRPEHAMSRIYTFYTVTRLSRFSDVVFDVEEASGVGLSNSNGLAGFTNIDVVRIPGEGTPLSTAPYLARINGRYVVPLGSEWEEAEVGPQGNLPSLPVRRLELRVGKFPLPDVLDVNGVGSDSHLQFMNWTIVNNGAWDYAADTRGYTVGALLELHARSWSVRFVEALMPKIANGIDLEWNLARARGNNLEFEFRPRLAKRHKTALRLLAYRNVADMGNYRQAITEFLAHQTAVPDIIGTRRQGRTKNGIGLNLEQELSHTTRAFLRIGAG
ncbi:MAG: porin, partial [Acidobacteria bacterium]|nr:porin [Acidobacteriota bacterium]